MLVAPKNYFLVKLQSKYSDELHFTGGVKLHIDPTWNPNFHATMTGIVHSVPLEFTVKVKQKILPTEEILFGYKVVGDTTFEDDSKAFRMITKGEGYLIEWQNGQREHLRMEKGMTNQWVAVLTDKKGDLVSGTKGSFGNVENWVSQFKFAAGQGLSYDNEINYNGEVVWKVDIDFVFAVKKQGHWVAVGDYVMIEPMAEKKPKLFIPGGLTERTESDTLVVREDKGWVRLISTYGTKMGVRAGDVVLFDRDMKEKYNFEGRPIYIIRQQFIYAKEL
jgi:hypothetical protein